MKSDKRLLWADSLGERRGEMERLWNSEYSEMRFQVKFGSMMKGDGAFHRVLKKQKKNEG